MTKCKQNIMSKKQIDSYDDINTQTHTQTKQTTLIMAHTRRHSYGQLANIHKHMHTHIHTHTHTHTHAKRAHTHTHSFFLTRSF